MRKMTVGASGKNGKTFLVGATGATQGTRDWDTPYGMSSCMNSGVAVDFLMVQCEIGRDLAPKRHIDVSRGLNARPMYPQPSLPQLKCTTAAESWPRRIDGTYGVLYASSHKPDPPKHQFYIWYSTGRLKLR